MDGRGGSSRQGNHGPGDFFKSFSNQPNKLERQSSHLPTSSAEEFEPRFDESAVPFGESTSQLCEYDDSTFIAPPGFGGFRSENSQSFQSGPYDFATGSSSISNTNVIAPSSLMQGFSWPMSSFNLYGTSGEYENQFGITALYPTPGGPNVNPNELMAPRAASERYSQPSPTQTRPLDIARSGGHPDEQVPFDVHDNMGNGRYHITLSAPTAMLKHLNDIPITYLNKSQTYSITIKDVRAQAEVMPPRKYRTAVRISFEDANQRGSPADSWKLWKEGRGTNEAHKRGHRLLAVEYVPPEENPSQVPHGTRPNLVHLVEHFDGFVVEWSPGAGKHECVLQARFHFLSTDFSHSKGVKGIPVRLCAKTEAVEPFNPSVPNPTKQILYCKVKTFRDHGAERKIANDKQHVSKNIEKMKQQKDQQAEANAKSGLKRRRSSDAASAERVLKVPKHERSNSASTISQEDTPDDDEDGFDTKIRNLENAVTTIRQTSVLDLEGDDLDDLDSFPIPLPSSAAEANPKDIGNDLHTPQQDLPRVTEKPSTVTTSSTAWSPGMSRRANAALQYPTPFGASSRTSSNDTPIRDAFNTQPKIEPQLSEYVSASSERPVSVQGSRRASGHPTPWLEAIHVDSSYIAPPEPAVKPVACFYVQPFVLGRGPGDDYFRAVYLMERCVKSLVEAIAKKCGVNASQIIDTVRVNSKQQKIKVEDELVKNMDEGQAMVAELDLVHRTHESAEEFMLGHDNDDDEAFDSAPEQLYKLILRF
ncbi:MAG: hypothetical protein M1831_006185 [Alyxoria varia]|nr:MAG: hypothetical protein M1831_006185 [Alyxoria varia]